MAQTYLSPGVYIEEVERGTKPIQAVGTSTAAFIGITQEAGRKALNASGQRVEVESRLNKPTLVTNWTQFVETFGSFVPGAFLPDAVYTYFANGGGPCYITSLRALNTGAAHAAEATIPSKGKAGSFTLRAKDPSAFGLPVEVKVTAEDSFDLRVGAESRTGLTMKKGQGYVGDADFEKVEIVGVGPATAMPLEGNYVLGVAAIEPLAVTDFVGDAAERTGLGGLEAIDEVRLVLCPDLLTGYDGSEAARMRVKQVQEAMIAHCERMRYRFAILDTPPGLNAQQAIEWRKFINFDTSYAALYYPWIQIADISGSGHTSKMVPPSGAVAGIYNRTDADRGVHKAPANDTVLGAIDLELQLSKGEQDLLNPIGVNCIRVFPGRGVRVWGARTLSSDGAWRYINVRRLFIMVEASLDAGMQWVVFEPNDRTLWARVRRDASAFLKTIWLGGALFGNTPEEAFYVKCDDELNPPEIRDLGQLIIEVGLAPVKPAEFVIFRLTQWAGANAEG